MKPNTLKDVMKSVTTCDHGDGCEDCCWRWEGCVDKKGYGRVSFQGVRYTSHSLLYKLCHGLRLTEKVNIAHTCIDHPWCCNWHHCFITSDTTLLSPPIEVGLNLSTLQNNVDNFDNYQIVLRDPCTCAPRFLCEVCKKWDKENGTRKSPRTSVAVLQDKIDKTNYTLLHGNLSTLRKKGRKHYLKILQAKLDKLEASIALLTK